MRDAAFVAEHGANYLEIGKEPLTIDAERDIDKQKFDMRLVNN